MKKYIHILKSFLILFFLNSCCSGLTAEEKNAVVTAKIKSEEAKTIALESFRKAQDSLEKTNRISKKCYQTK